MRMRSRLVQIALSIVLVLLMSGAGRAQEKHHGALSRIAVLTIWAEDVTTTAHFYKDVLQLPLVDSDHYPHIRFHLKGAQLILLKGKPRAAENAEPAEFPLFALTVEDLDKAVARLKAHNVAMPRGIEGKGANRWVMFRDPAGNLIELVQDH